MENLDFMIIKKKNNFNWGVFFLLLHLLFLSACNITYKVRNQHHEVESILHTSCGKITIELMGRGNSKFIIRQKFDLSDRVTIYMDSLHVYFNNKQIKINHNLKNEMNPQTEVELKENDVWETSFEFEKGIFEGDTIMVFGPSYVHCKDHIITLDSIFYSFTNRLRIYGINDF